MSAKRYEYNAAVRRKRRVRATVKASGRLRLSVYRSARHIYAQVINDLEGKTLASASSLDSSIEGGSNQTAAKAVGILLAERAKAAGVEEVAFDRGSYPYHGRVKVLAEAARENGLKF